MCFGVSPLKLTSALNTVTIMTWKNTLEIIVPVLCILMGLIEFSLWVYLTSGVSKLADITEQ